MPNCKIMISAFVLIVPAPAFSRERVLLPTDDWTVDRLVESCRLTRNFAATDGKKVRLRLQSFGPATSFKFTLVGSGLPLRQGATRGAAKFQYRLKPDRDWRSGLGATGTVSGEDALTFVGDLAAGDDEASRDTEQNEWKLANSPEAFARMAEIEGLSIAYPARDDTVLPLAGLGEKAGELGQCGRDLLSSWGYDPARILSLTSTPKLLNSRNIGGDLLGAMTRLGLGSNDSLHARLEIGEQGNVTSCIVQQPRQNTELGDLICDALRDKARFAPALNQQGRPTSAPYFATINFSYY